MSSAALQPVAGLPTPSHRHTSSHSSPTPEGYHATRQQQQQHQQVSIASSTTSPRPSRKSSSGADNNNYPNNTGIIPSSPAQASQPNPQPTARPAYASSASSSVAANAAAVSMSEYAQPSPPASSERRRHAAPVAPPRTSSTRYDQQSVSSVPPSNSARRPVLASSSTPSSGTDSPRRQRESRGGTSSSSSAYDDSAQRKQRSQVTPEEYAQRKAAAASRAATASGTSHVPVKEQSEILSTMLVSRDEVDVERERARSILAQSNQETMDDVGADDAAPPPVVPNNAHDAVDDGRRRSRHDHSRREKQIKFGEYILGNTIGEGEFGKVKLGWKQEGGVQVAIKLIKKDSLGSNPTRMAKIMREVNILKQLNHPNIVQLHKMEESEHHYGIVLEYASGGELFDYILNHRYLKDHSARRLFAQLISGVGYLHKKGIVHRDLKLENLLLDRNRNIIITDFGFANTFEPTEELSEDEEVNLADRDWVKRMGFDRVKPNGMRKADLMQTSCGSPCYAAPELVVSDSLYTGRKVDVWSCGVILYAMLAGYLPFDDDPKNPEGDNINLLYKYIVNTPLTFPEYVTPHARDLLRRILVPDPRKRADLFEVARHSWLSEYANVVEFITSSTTTSGDIQNITTNSEEFADGSLGRSASVREAPKKAAAPAIGGLSSKQGTIDQDESATVRQQKDSKRRTVQVEYVAPTTQTQRGETNGQLGAGSGGKTRARPITQGPVAVSTSQMAPASNKPLPREPPTGKEAYTKPSRESKRPPSAHRNLGSAVMAGANQSRPSRMADTAYMSSGRPMTGGSMASTGSRTAHQRASFGQPAPPTVAGTNVHGRIQQPTGNSARSYISMPQDSSSIGRPSISVPSKFAQVSGFSAGNGQRASTAHGEARGHRRSNTLGDITDKLLGRSGSIFGGKNRKRPEPGAEKASRRYPPVSMSNTAASVPNIGGDEPRASMDSTVRHSRRSFSISLGKKRSGSVEGSQTSQEKQHNRRFTLLTGFSRKEDRAPDSQLDLPIQDPPTEFDDHDGADVNGHNNTYEEVPVRQLQQAQQSQQPQQRYAPRPSYEQQHAAAGRSQTQAGPLREMPDNVQRNPPQSAPYPMDHMEPDGLQDQEPRRAASRSGRVVLQKNNKRFMDAYDTDEYAKHHDRSGSSGAARRVMDFFRRRGKARGGDD